MATIATTTLHCHEGSSDKVYVPAIVENPAGGFNVVAAYGRRGAALQHLVKANAVDYGKAQKEYAKLIAAKVAKGYRPIDCDTIAVAAVSERDGRSANVPIQLLTPLTERESDALLNANPRVVVQEKKDGDRRLVVVGHDGNVAGVNRRGCFVPLAPAIASAASALPFDSLLDGELVGETFFAFDAQRIAGGDLTEFGFGVRFAALQATLANAPSSAIALVPCIAGDDRAPRIAALREAGAEGVVLRHSDAPYTAGRGTTACKFKFYSTASVTIVAHNDKHSVGMAVYDGTERVTIGNVTIPPSIALPAIGAIVEVRYLYAYPGGSLYQPTFLAVRSDCHASDCALAQLALKGTDG